MALAKKRVIHFTSQYEVCRTMDDTFFQILLIAFLNAVHTYWFNASKSFETESTRLKVDYLLNTFYS